MRLIIDTHTLIWAVDDPSQLSATAASALQDSANELLLSAASIWELAIKIGQGKLTLALPYREWMTKAVADLDLSILPVTIDYADEQSRLPMHHKDPFGRLIIAQAIHDGISVVGADSAFDDYGVNRIW